MKIALVLCLVTLVPFCSTLKLPPGFKKCDKRASNFNECLSKAIHGAIRQLNKPIPQYNLPRIDTIFVTPRPIETGNSTNGVLQKYTNGRLSGHTKLTNTKAEMDFGSKTLNLELDFPEIRFDADLEIIGSILILPVNNSGTVTAIYEKPKFTLTFRLESYEKENNKYYKISKTTFAAQVEKASFKFNNLFEDKNLNDAFNAQLEAKWRSIFEYIQRKYSIVFERLYGKLFGLVLDKVPINELFDGVA